jgi:hypothetical protein
MQFILSKLGDCLCRETRLIANMHHRIDTIHANSNAVPNINTKLKIAFSSSGVIVIGPAKYTIIASA